MGRHGLAMSSRPRSDKVQKKNPGGGDGVFQADKSIGGGICRTLAVLTRDAADRSEQNCEISITCVRER
jgi:hypothetical protein